MISVTKTKTIAFIAAFSGANAALRVLLVGGPPNVKPTAFLVIISGIIGGPMAGVAVGWLSMTLSDLYFGAGIWTIETSTGMAVVGLLAGLLWHKSNRLNRWVMAIAGFLITMVFDIGTSIADAVLFHYPVWVAMAGLYVPFMVAGASPYPFGFVDELTTATLLGLMGPSLVSRIRNFYH
ncbi:MAG: ECF transporter S component [Candidatus Bathyarchaeia archaeon]